MLVMLACASLAGALYVQYQRTTRHRHPTIGLSEMQVHIAAGDALILDARDQVAFGAGHLPGASSLPLDEWKKRSAELNDLLYRYRNRLVIVYCANRWCSQAEDLQVALIDQGHRNVGVFAAGFDAWREAGLSVVTGPP